MRGLLLAVLLLVPAAAWPRAGGGGGGGGGCFPAGTLIETAAGPIAIEKIKPGDTVLAYSEEGIVQARVRETFARKDRLHVIRTPKGRITATPEHPFLTRDGFTEVRALKAGTEIGFLEEGRRVWTKIKSIKPGGVAPVFNLEVDPPHTYIAAGFVVHNKGGFGGGYHSSSYGSSYDGYDSYGRRRRSRGLSDLIFIGIALIFVFFKNLTSGRFSGGSAAGPGRPPQLLPNGPVMQRSDKTLDIIRSLARRDPDFNPEALEAMVKSVFMRVQAAWQARDYGPLTGVMMPTLYASHSSKVEALRYKHHTNMMEDLQVQHIDFVHVRCPENREGRSVTALVTASARDYTVDDRDNSLVSGSRAPQTFQEYWTFHQLNGRWALARIDQVGEMDFLNAINLPAEPEKGAQFAEKAAQYAAGAGSAFAAAGITAARPAAAAPAPAVPPAPAEPVMDRQKMEIAATLAFESVYEAWGRNDSTRLSPDCVSEEALKKLTLIMEDRKAESLTFEFASFFTRRAEVVLSAPASRSRFKMDEFTARISATAVRAMRRNGKVLHKDEAPQPFTEYWVFGRRKGGWVLMDILPRMDQSGEDRAQDGAPNPTQIEWYWGEPLSR
jgi:predicted lipid-binding transport protein (Tim44 family)